jgi:hypothetical protein
MFGYQFFDAVSLVDGFASSLLNLCNLRNLRIFNLRDLGLIHQSRSVRTLPCLGFRCSRSFAARSTPAHADGPAPKC